MRKLLTSHKRLARGAALAGLLLLGSASGLSWRTGDLVRVERTEVIRDDVYIAGNDVVVDGTIEGDLIVAGEDVTVNGRVLGDLWAAGETVTIGGNVEQTARLAGSVLLVSSGADIGEDLLAAGLGLDLLPGAVVGRDVAFGGRQIRLGGSVTRNALISANALAVSGLVNGDARFVIDDGGAWPTVWTGNLARPEPLGSGLRFEPGGRVNGDLALVMPEPPVLAPGAVEGRVAYSPLRSEDRDFTATPAVAPAQNVLLGILRDFATVAIAGLLLVWLVRGALQGVIVRLRDQPGASLGYGTVAFVGLPFAVLVTVGLIVLLALLLGVLGLGNLAVPLAFVGAPLLLGSGAFVAWAAWLAAQGAAAYFIGEWLIRTVRRDEVPRPTASVLVGAFALALLLAVPVLGWVVTLAALLLALGGLWLWWRRGPHSVNTKGGPAVATS